MIASEMTREISKLISTADQQYASVDSQDSSNKAFYALKKVTLGELLFLWKAVSANRADFGTALGKLEARVNDEMSESFGGEQQAYKEVKNLIAQSS